MSIIISYWLVSDNMHHHLDIDMREALALALQEYEGAIILVSHDRYLVRACIDQLKLVAHHQVVDFDGDLDEYETWLKEYRKQSALQQEKGEADQTNKKLDRKEAALLRERLKPLTDEIKKLEKK